MHFRSDALCGPARKPDPVGSLVPPCKPAANIGLGAEAPLLGAGIKKGEEGGKVQNHNLYLATFAAVLGPLSFGFVLGYSSPAIPSLKRSHNPELRLDDTQASWFG
ncbi:hypothetical protein E2320_006451, partial [Naja naja]